MKKAVKSVTVAAILSASISDLSHLGSVIINVTVGRCTKGRNHPVKRDGRAHRALK